MMSQPSPSPSITRLASPAPRGTRAAPRGSETHFHPLR